MPDIAMGRKEIMKALHVASWDTIRRWKRKRGGFRRVLRSDPGGKPFIIISEVKEYMLRYDEMRKKAAAK